MVFSLQKNRMSISRLYSLLDCLQFRALWHSKEKTKLISSNLVTADFGSTNLLQEAAKELKRLELVHELLSSMELNIADEDESNQQL